MSTVCRFTQLTPHSVRSAATSITVSCLDLWKARKVSLDMRAKGVDAADDLGAFGQCTRDDLENRCGAEEEGQNLTAR